MVAPSSTTPYEAFAYFCEKFPDLAFFFQLEREGKILSLELAEENPSLIGSSQVIFLFGIEWALSRVFLEKLKQSGFPNRVILVIQDLDEIAAFLETFPDLAILAMDTLIFKYAKLEDLETLKAIALSFPSALVEVHFAKGMDTELCEKARLCLLKGSFLAIAALREVLFSSTLLRNYLTNGKAASSAFSSEGLKDKGKGIPAIICGAGPSLDGCLQSLKTVSDQAIILAAGSAITALGNANIEPHLLVAIDPNTHEYFRLRDMKAFEAPLIHYLRLCGDVEFLTSSPRCLIPTAGLPWMEPFEACIEESSSEIVTQMDAESSSVITMATALAVYLGCDPIIFCGVDLAYSSDQEYSHNVSLRFDNAKEGNSHVESENILVEEGSLISPIKWWAEAAAMGRYLSKFPERTFINTSHGLEIGNTQTMSFNDFLQRYDLAQRDLQGLIHALIQQPLCFNQLGFEKLEEALKESLNRSQDHLETMLESFEDKLEFFLAEEALSKEIAYNDFLNLLKGALGFLEKKESAWDKETILALLEATQNLKGCFEPV